MHQAAVEGEAQTEIKLRAEKQGVLKRWRLGPRAGLGHLAAGDAMSQL